VHVHNDYGYVRDVTTGGDGRWEVFLDSHTRDDLASGLWHVAVTENGQNASDEVSFAFSTDCNAGIQRVQIDWQRSSSSGAVNSFDRNGDGQVTCADFNTRSEAQIALNAGYANLDSDHDGIPCENLPP